MKQRCKMEEKILAMVCELMICDAEEVKLETNLREDLNCGSLDMIELVVTLEDEYGIEIGMEDTARIETVSDAVTLVLEKLKAGAGPRVEEDEEVEA
jgi:acyl carrier protein